MMITKAVRARGPGALSCRDTQEGQKLNSPSAPFTLTQLSHYTIMLFIYCEVDRMVHELISPFDKDNTIQFSMGYLHEEPEQ